MRKSKGERTGEKREKIREEREILSLSCSCFLSLGEKVRAREGKGECVRETIRRENRREREKIRALALSHSLSLSLSSPIQSESSYFLEQERERESKSTRGKGRVRVREIERASEREEKREKESDIAAKRIERVLFRANILAYNREPPHSKAHCNPIESTPI